MGTLLGQSIGPGHDRSQLAMPMRAMEGNPDNCYLRPIQIWPDEPER
jgi:hypothetical protein